MLAACNADEVNRTVAASMGSLFFIWLVTRDLVLIYNEGGFGRQAGTHKGDTKTEKILINELAWMA
jgi:hypothetical protein